MHRSHTKHIAIILLALVVSTVAVATAWAALSITLPIDTTTDIVQKATDGATTDAAKQSRSRAPEPSTLALFGSSIFGMIVRFVRKSYRACKRCFDIIAATIALIILAPFCALIAALIKITSPGPIFYTQTRVGKDGNLFKIFKFRTMNSNAEKKTGAVWARLNDNRLTPIGGFLRKAHIDEIPQFVNVLRGDMSIIGPRPERPEFVKKFKQEISDYEKRISVKPGITGLAQVWHKYDESMNDVRKKLKYDLLYLKKICLWTDFLIMLRTVRVVLTGEGAR